MRIIPPKVFEQHFAQMYNDSTMKFVCIGEWWYSVDYLSLLMSGELKALGMAWLDITQELLDSFPPPRQPVDFVTEELLIEQPIIMFESTVDEGRYFRFDGRHRIMGAHKLGFSSFPSIWVPKSLWAQFIIGRETPKAKYSHMPYRWKRPKEDEHTQFGYHDEPNFLKPPEVKSVEYKKIEIEASNARSSLSNPYGGCYKPPGINPVHVLKKSLRDTVMLGR